MSADNWTDCPWCMEAHENEREERKLRVLGAAEAQYGAVPSAQFIELMQKAQAEVQRFKAFEYDTLHEDYEIGIRSGAFNVSYSAQCKRCGQRFVYEYSCVPQATNREEPKP